MVSELRLIEHCAEFRPRQEVSKISKGTRGIYALLQERLEGEAIRYDVVYIGMSRSGIQGRLKSHLQSKKKATLWSHFSVYAVWPNITDAEISELEGLFRAMYRKDSAANRIAVQKVSRNWSRFETINSDGRQVDHAHAREIACRS